MDTLESLNHSVWDCKYHVVFIPKYRRRALYAELRRYLGDVFKKLAAQKESRIEEGHLLADHVHMLIAVPRRLELHHPPGHATHRYHSYCLTALRVCKGITE